MMLTRAEIQCILAEGVGTAILVTAIVLASSPQVPTNVAVAFALGGAIYALDHISSHFNPAVTLGAFLAGKMKWYMAVLYMISQTTAGVAAAFVANSLRDTQVASFNPPQNGPAFAVEFIYTFALVLVMQNAAMTKHASEPNSYYGIAISFVVLAGAKVCGGISGGCFNPAVGTGIDFATLPYDKTSADDLWIYWLAPFLGAALAAATAWLMNRAEARHWELTLPLGPCFQTGKASVVVLLTEFIGTYLLALTASLAGDGLAIAGILIALVYMGEHVCGADYNPSVTFGVAVRNYFVSGDLPLPKIAAIMTAQYMGGLAAGISCWYIAGDIAYPSPEGYKGVLGAFVWEGGWVAVLVLVVCGVMTDTGAAVSPAPTPAIGRSVNAGTAARLMRATSDGVAGDDVVQPGDLHTRGHKHARSYQGLAIGFIIASGVYSSSSDGAASGGVFNPALGLGILSANRFFTTKDVSHTWIYVLAPFVGAAIGATIFLVLHAGRFRKALGDPEVVTADVEGTERAPLLLSNGRGASPPLKA